MLTQGANRICPVIETDCVFICHFEILRLKTISQTVVDFIVTQFLFEIAQVGFIINDQKFNLGPVSVPIKDQKLIIRTEPGHRAFYALTKPRLFYSIEVPTTSFL